MKRTLLLAFALLLGGAVNGAMAQTPDDADGDGFHDGDVEVVNAIIANNGLAATSDAPASWTFATWDTSSPKRISRLNIQSKSLTGALDVSGLAALTQLLCYYNKLTELNMSGLTALTRLDCEINQLTALDVSGLTALREVTCYGNTFTTLVAKNGKKVALSVPQAEGGSATFSGYYPGRSGNYVYLMATKNTGCTFTGWTAEPEVTFIRASDLEHYFTMPDADVAITASFDVPVVEPEPELSVSPALLDFAAAGGQKTFTITSNTDWTVAGNESWLTVSPASGSNNGTITVTAAANGATTPRTATVTVSGTGVTAQAITVAQAAAEDTPPPPPPPTEPAEYTILAWAGDNGAISPAGAAAVREGTDQTFTFTPAAGYAVDGVTVDGKAVAKEELTGDSYTFRKVAAYHEIAVTFRPATVVNEEVEAGLKAYSLDGQLYVSGLTLGEAWSVYSVTGAVVYNGTADSGEAVISLPAAGIYIVRTGGSTVKVAATN